MARLQRNPATTLDEFHFVLPILGAKTDDKSAEAMRYASKIEQFRTTARSCQGYLKPSLMLPSTFILHPRLRSLAVKPEEQVFS
ncbi:hypothetical protein C2U70_25060 [Bradyrhizobium guangdongense]|nr:hypothetical protein C2U70_25060 [Bradyrhizobium guangdongense]